MIANLLLYAYVVYILKVQVFCSTRKPTLSFMGNLCGTAALGYTLGAVETQEATKTMIAVLLTNF